MDLFPVLLHRSMYTESDEFSQSSQYIFPLLMVLMELMMDIHHLSLSKVIDFKEWVVPYTSFLAVRATAAKHLELLQSKRLDSRPSYAW